MPAFEDQEVAQPVRNKPKVSELRPGPNLSNNPSPAQAHGSALRKLHFESSQLQSLFKTCAVGRQEVAEIAKEIGFCRAGQYLQMFS